MRAIILYAQTAGISFWMEKANIRLWLVLAVLLMHFVVASVAHADRRLDIFIEKYNALNGRTPPLAHIDSPFYPYHKHLFEQGLDEANLKALRDAQKKGKCILVDELVVKGFLGLFPFLKPAFDNRKRHTNLLFMIAKDGRPEDGRCMDHSRMRELLTLRPLGALPAVDFAERGISQSYVPRDPKGPHIALHGFGRRAFCDDYPPSIGDLRAIANRPGGMVLTEQEGLYLLERARVHGLDKGKYVETFALFKKHFSPDANLSRLRTASRWHKLADIGFKVEGYWQSQCRFERGWRQKKLLQ